MSCKQSSLDSSESQLDCVYRVGRDLEFVIAGVGGSDAGITVTKTSGYSGDYYATFGVMHGCVIVKPGSATIRAEMTSGVHSDMAFVSPKTGKVYTSWPECKKASAREPSNDR